MGGCESGFAVPDPINNDIVWSGCYEGILDRYDASTGHSPNVQVWPENAEAWAAEDIRYRFQWTFPITISPHDHNRVYVGSQFVHVTTNGGHSWSVISPDLTSDDKSKQKKTGGLTPDDAGPTLAPVIFALAESPVQQGLLWAGTNDGLFHVTRDSGKSWTNVTPNIPNLPPWGTVSNIEASRYAAGTAYMTVDFHQVNDTRPFVYKTTDFGASWASLRSNLPHTVYSYAHVVREDPVRQGLLYLGTENSLYVSFDDGLRWTEFQTNLPHAPVHWLTIQEHFNDLAVATYGRGFWILDDVTPLQQLDQQILDSAVHLFDPRPAYRFASKENHMSQPADPVSGENPEYGASLHFYLAEAPAEQDAAEVKIDVLDSSNQVIRTLERLERNAVAGINRVYWDLSMERSKEPKLLTKPDEHSHVALEQDGSRPLSEGRGFAPTVVPGEYTIRLSRDETVHETRLSVLKDPNTSGTLEDIQKQHRVLLELRDMLNQGTELINEVESLRRQLLDREELIEGREGASEVIEQSKELREQLRDYEGNFFDLRLTNARQDSVRWRRNLYSRMGILAGVISQADYPPTTQQLEVFELFKRQLADITRRMELMRRGEINRFNRLLREKGFNQVLSQ